MTNRALSLASASAVLVGLFSTQTAAAAADYVNSPATAQTNAISPQATANPASTVQWKTFQSISAPGDGTIFGVSTDREVYRWNGEGWVRVEGTLKQVSAGSSTEVWGVNDEHNVWQATSNGWVQRPGAMKEVRVAKGGAVVVALDLSGKPYMWNGTGWTALLNAPLLQTLQIGADAQSLYGVGDDKQLYRWRPRTQTWAKVSGKFKKLTVGRDGTVGGVTEADGAYVRTDADVTAEIEMTGNPTGWLAFPQTVGEFEIVDSRVALLTDRTGLMIQAGTGYDTKTLVTGLIELKSELQVGEITPDPTTSFYSNNLTLIDASAPRVQVKVNQCAILSGTLPLNGLQQVQAPVAATCITGKFQQLNKKYATHAVSPPVSQSALTLQMPLTLPGLSNENTGQQSIARTSGFMPQRITAGTGPIVCPTRNFYDLSKHSYVTFTMPEGRYNEQIQIPAGAYNKYVFPACNRVWWTNLVFACTVNPVNRNTEWTLLYGRYDADAACTGTPGAKFYFSYGDR